MEFQHVETGKSEMAENHDFWSSINIADNTVTVIYLQGTHSSWILVQLVEYTAGIM